MLKAAAKIKKESSVCCTSKGIQCRRIRDIRKKTGLSQKLFADYMGGLKQWKPGRPVQTIHPERQAVF